MSKRAAILAGLAMAAMVIPGMAAAPAASAQTAEQPDVAPWIAMQVHPKVHLLTTPDDYFGPAVGNAILVEQSDGFVVIDSGLNAGNGRKLVAYARYLSPKPIKAVAITHWHNDHPQGVSAIRDAFPNVRIIATAATEAGMLGPEAGLVGFRPDPRLESEL